MRKSAVLATLSLMVIAALLVASNRLGLRLPWVSGEGQEDQASDAQTGLAPPVPSFSHVYLLVLENHGRDEIVGSPDAPYLNALIARYGLATNYDALTTPSQPNYLALFSGGTDSVADNEPHDLADRNLADQIEAQGKSWRVFAENVPLGCFRGASASGGPDGPGTYVRKHEPAISFTDISGSPARCANITDFGDFDPSAADFALIVPNLCHDMHDCGVSTGDQFLHGFLPRILESAAWQQGGVLFITFDDASGHPTDEGGDVATLVISPTVAPGFSSSAAHSHYSLLRTIEEAWHLGCLGASCQANDLGEFFAQPAGASTSAAP